MLTCERGGSAVFVHSGGAYSRDKVVEMVAGHQVRDGSADFVLQVMRVCFVHHRHRQ